MEVEIDGRLGKLEFTNYDNFIGREISYFPFQGMHVLCVAFNGEDDTIHNIRNWIDEGKRYSSVQKLQIIIIGMYDSYSTTYDVPNIVKDLMYNSHGLVHYVYYARNTIGNLFKQIDHCAAYTREHILTEDVMFVVIRNSISLKYKY